MSLVTGTPYSAVSAQEEIYLDGAPNIYFQDNAADPLFNPDANGYYWGMSGTAAYAVKELACVTEVAFGQGVTANDIRCDTIGLKGTIQRRDYVELTFTLQSMLPLSTYSQLAGFSTAVVGSGRESVGIGEFDNTQYWMVYAPKVYNADVGDYLLIHLHRCQFVEPGELQMRYGEPWMQSFSLRGYADTTKLSTMSFGTIIRSDLSAIP